MSYQRLTLERHRPPNFLEQGQKERLEAWKDLVASTASRTATLNVTQALTHGTCPTRGPVRTHAIWICSWICIDTQYMMMNLLLEARRV